MKPSPPWTVSRVQSCVATDSEVLLRPQRWCGAQHDVEKRWLRELVSEAAHDRDGCSGRIGEQNRTHREQIRVAPLHSVIRYRMACARMMGRFSFVTLHGGADAIVCDSSACVADAEPGAPWLRAGCGSAAFDSPSHAF